MAKVFLDTNYFIDAVHRRPEKEILDNLISHIICVSTLSFHIYCYVFKIQIPNKNVLIQKQKFEVVDFSQLILERSLNNPTSDLEDNVQLHSAAEANCDFFLTEDKKILDMKFFGKTRIIPNLKF